MKTEAKRKNCIAFLEPHAGFVGRMQAYRDREGQGVLPKQPHLHGIRATTMKHLRRQARSWLETIF